MTQTQNNSFQPQDEHFRARVQTSFARQRVMQTLGINLTRIEPGLIELYFPYQIELTQQHGFRHAGIMTTALDNACGYAAFSLMPSDAAVLTIEFKSNFLAPAQGEQFRILGHVIKPGRTITVCQAEAFAEPSGQLIATMSCTLMAVFERGLTG